VGDFKKFTLRLETRTTVCPGMNAKESRRGCQVLDNQFPDKTRSTARFPWPLTRFSVWHIPASGRKFPPQGLLEKNHKRQSGHHLGAAWKHRKGRGCESCNSRPAVDPRTGTICPGKFCGKKAGSPGRPTGRLFGS